MPFPFSLKFSWPHFSSWQFLFSSDRFWLSLRFIFGTLHSACIRCGVARLYFMRLARHVLSTQTEKYRCTLLLLYLLHAFNLLIVVCGSIETSRHPVTVLEIICTVALAKFSSQCQVHWSVYDCQMAVERSLFWRYLWNFVARCRKRWRSAGSTSQFFDQKTLRQVFPDQAFISFLDLFDSRI